MSKDGAGFAAGGYFPSISGDGCRISFVSEVSLALPFSPGGQVYVRDRCASPVTITRASVLSGTTTPAPGYFDEFGESYAISGEAGTSCSKRLRISTGRVLAPRASTSMTWIRGRPRE